MRVPQRPKAEISGEHVAHASQRATKPSYSRPTTKLSAHKFSTITRLPPTPRNMLSIQPKPSTSTSTPSHSHSHSPASASTSTSPPTTKVTPHLLPIRTSHNGAVNATPRHWNPVTDASGQQISHLRGRRLLGREIQLPETHRGVVARTTERVEMRVRGGGGDGVVDGAAGEQQRIGVGEGEMDEGGVDEEMDEGEEDEEDDKEEVRILEEVAGFDRVVVWGHDEVPADDEEFVRGVGEWIGFAEGVHSYDEPK